MFHLVLLLAAALPWAAGEVIAKTMIGSISYTVSRETDAEIWRLTVPSTPLKRVHFCFTELNVNSAELQVYDLEDYQRGQGAVFDCIGCGRDLPPMFSSRTGTIIIFIKGVIGVNFISSAFHLTYVAEPVSFSHVQSHYSSLSLSYNMAYGKLFPLTAESKIPASAKTTWAISVPSSQITFSFDSFPAQAALACGAVLTIYDGSSTAAGILFNGSIASGLPSTWRYSSSGKVLAVLQNGPAQSTCNFEVSYYADSSLYHCGSLFAPDILKSKSMILSDGSALQDNMRRGETCTWRVLSGESAPIYDTFYTSSASSSGIADQDSRLTLLFSWVQLKTGGRVVVYNSDGIKGNVLWDSEGTNTVVPPPLRSTGTSLYVSYFSNSQLSTGFRGFRGEYLTRTLGSPGIGSQREVYSMSSALDITPPGYSCYGSDPEECVYTAGLDYSFLIKPLSIAAGGSISFIFSSIDLTSTGDSLTIYDGVDYTAPVLARWEGQEAPHVFPFQWINSTGQVALVRFVSKNIGGKSGNFKYGGFKFSYYSDGPNYHCGFSTNPATLQSPNHVISDGSATVQSMLASQNCQWKVDPANSPGGVVLIFHKMDIDAGSSIIVYSQDETSGSRVVLVTISNTKAIPAPITSQRKMYISYRTSSTPTGLGFLASYISAQGINTKSGSKDGKIHLFCSSVTKLELPPSSLILGSSLYEPGWTVEWDIRPSTSSGPIFIVFNDLKLPVDCSDYLALYANRADGLSELVWTSCSESSAVPRGTISNNAILPYDKSWVAVNSSGATLKFLSSSESTGNSSFNVAYNTDGKNFHCGFSKNPAVLNSESFVFTDGSASSERMYRNQDCEWLIDPRVSGVSAQDPGEQNDKVVVFLTLHLADLAGAHLQIYDGDSADSGVLLWECNGCTHAPPQLVSEFGSFFVRFTSTDSDFLGFGFRLYYYTVAVSSDIWNSGVRDPDAQACSRPTEDYYTTVSDCVMTTQVVLEQPYDFQFDDTLSSVPELEKSGQVWKLDYPGRTTQKQKRDSKGKVLPPTYTRPVGVLSFWPSTKFQSTATIPFLSDIGDRNLFRDVVRSGKVDNTWTKQSALFEAEPRSGHTKDRYYCGTWHTEIPTVDIAESTGSYDENKYSRADRNNSLAARSPVLVDRVNQFKLRPSQVTGKYAAYVAPPNVWAPGQQNLATSPDMIYTFENDDQTYSKVPFSKNASTAGHDIPYPASMCKYSINTAPGVFISAANNGKGSGGFPVTFRVQKTSCSTTSTKRLRIFGGIYGNDTLLYDSSGVVGVSSGVSSVVAACGRAILLVDNVDGSSAGPGEDSSAEICGFDIDYSVDYSDDQSKTCDKYIRSIYYEAPEPVDYMIYLIPIVGVVVALLCLCCCVLYIPGLILKLQGKYNNYNGSGFNGMRRNVKTTSLHPRYTPKLDQWRKKLLKRGTCCVCKDGPYPVFRLGCSHELCEDDLKGYIESALGDVSMFPVKCPMHFEGCTGTIGSDVAKKVVSKPQYTRFIDFLDRALFGDGIRCIFCENFVIYPANSKISMVTCPYCVQIFCMRCRQPWHYGAQKCPLEKAEDECLEIWKATSGAQRCPACRKLIEKDDPDTCHHMVHRSSDGIPCLRDRTDFCYLCGIEVAAEYPHDEINNDNVGVNHFPDGVFQKCRTIINRDKAEEREKLRKSKRMRKSPTKKIGYSSNFVMPTEWDNETASTPGAHSNNDVELVRGPAVDGEDVLPPPSGDRNRFESDFDAPWEEVVRTHPASPVPTRPARRGQLRANQQAARRRLT